MSPTLTTKALGKGLTGTHMPFFLICSAFTSLACKMIVRATASE